MTKINHNEKVDILNVKKVVTHNGKQFHNDEVNGWVEITELNPNAELIRDRDPKSFEDADLVFDVGGEGFRYDHHKTNREKRANGIFYCGAGLLWRDFGYLIVKKYAPNFTEEEIQLVVAKMDTDYFTSICAEDNGQRIYSSNHRVITYSQIMYNFCPTEEDKSDGTTEFFQAVEFVRIIFRRELKNVIDYVKKVSELKPELKKKEIPEIFVIDDNTPWSESALEALIDIDKDVLYIVYKSSSGLYMTQAVGVKYGEFTNRKDLPSAWKGKRDSALEKVTGVEGAVFCHAGLFLAGAMTKEGAIKLANLAVSNIELNANHNKI